MVDRVLGPQATHERQRLVEPRRALARSMPNACCSCAVGDTEAERGQQPPAGHPVEARHRLRHQHRVAARKHHDAGAELQLLRATGRIGHADDGIGRLASDPLGQPQASRSASVRGRRRTGRSGRRSSATGCRGRSRSAPSWPDATTERHAPHSSSPRHEPDRGEGSLSAALDLVRMPVCSSGGLRSPLSPPAC